MNQAPEFLGHDFRRAYIRPTSEEQQQTTNCPTFRKLLRKIINIVDVRCHILSPKCIKFDFGCMGLRLRPRWGAYSAPQTPSWIYGTARGGWEELEGGGPPVSVEPGPLS